jgi:hypothetical protein
VHDAVGRQYLESMSFGVCRDAAQTDILEQFTYNFCYDNNLSIKVTDQHDRSFTLSMSQQSQVCSPSTAGSLHHTFDGEIDRLGTIWPFIGTVSVRNCAGTALL